MPLSIISFLSLYFSYIMIILQFFFTKYLLKYCWCEMILLSVYRHVAKHFVACMTAYLISRRCIIRCRERRFYLLTVYECCSNCFVSCHASCFCVDVMTDPILYFFFLPIETPPLPWRLQDPLATKVIIRLLISVLTTRK